MLIGRCDGLPAYVLTVAPLRIGLVVNKRRVAMVVVDPVHRAPSETDLAEFFGLSPAEARVAAAQLMARHWPRSSPPPASASRRCTRRSPRSGNLELVYKELRPRS